MDFVVVDTDVLSFCFKGDSRAELYRQHLEGHVLVVSFMTVAELRYWAMVRKWGVARRAKMERFLKRFVVHPFDDALCAAWAGVTHQAYRKGRLLPCADAWIAATAIVHDVPLITHNGHDFEYLAGLTVISEVDVQ